MLKIVSGNIVLGLLIWGWHTLVNGNRDLTVEGAVLLAVALITGVIVGYVQKTPARPTRSRPLQPTHNRLDVSAFDNIQ